MKAVSPTHLVLTVLPASFSDLKALTVTEETISKSEAHFVNMMQTPMSGGDTSSGDELSLETISNIELLTQEVRQAVPEVNLTNHSALF